METNETNITQAEETPKKVIGIPWTKDRQPTPEQMAKAREGQTKTRERKKFAGKITEAHIQQYKILSALLAAPEPPGPIRDAILAVLPIKPEEVTQYHGLTQRMVIEAHNGNVVAARYLSNERAAVVEYLRAVLPPEETEEAKQPFQIQIICKDETEKKEMEEGEMRGWLEEMGEIVTND